jgi:hypothetical protein|nr:MAG TPA: holin [Caudoviricetes sp.]
MFDKLKETIKGLAKTAVLKAEKALGSSKGQQKKEMAVNYVVEKIPVPALLKPLFSILLSSFIDDAVELAVEYMKSEVL